MIQLENFIRMLILGSELITAKMVPGLVPVFELGRFYLEVLF